MFRRRVTPELWRRVVRFAWPQTGWRRATAYFLHRIRRLPGSPQAIAAGVACGAAASFTPFLGLHFLLAALFAWSIGGSVIASAFGTVVGNPWTFPFIWYGIFRLGTFALGGDIGHTLPEGLTLTYMFDHPFAVLLPMTVGGIMAGAVAWVAVYWPVLGVVAEYQLLRRRRAARRAARDAAAGDVAKSALSAGKEGYR